MRLTATGYGLLRALSLNAGGVTTDDSLLRQVWGGHAASRASGAHLREEAPPQTVRKRSYWLGHQDPRRQPGRRGQPANEHRNRSPASPLPRKFEPRPYLHSGSAGHRDRVGGSRQVPCRTQRACPIPRKENLERLGGCPRTPGRRRQVEIGGTPLLRRPPAITSSVQPNPEKCTACCVTSSMVVATFTLRRLASLGGVELGRPPRGPLGEPPDLSGADPCA